MPPLIFWLDQVPFNTLHGAMRSRHLLWYHAPLALYRRAHAHAKPVRDVRAQLPGEPRTDHLTKTYNAPNIARSKEAGNHVQAVSSHPVRAHQ